MTFLTIVVSAMVVIVVALCVWFRTLFAELERDAPWLEGTAESPPRNPDTIQYDGGG